MGSLAFRASALASAGISSGPSWLQSLPVDSAGSGGIQHHSTGGRSRYKTLSCMLGASGEAPLALRCELQLQCLTLGMLWVLLCLTG